MKKTKVKINKLVYLGMSMLDFSKTPMYEFWYGYIKPKYGDRAKLYYTDTDSCIIYITTKDFYRYIAKDIENGLAHLTMMRIMIDHFQLARTKK